MSTRRDFITLLGGAAATWPLVARAQQAGKVPTIGFLGPTTRAAWDRWTPAFIQRLGELGWIEGRTIAIQYRWAEGSAERMEEIAAELVRLKVDVILTGGTSALAAKQATATIPIVIAVATDMLGMGIVASLARPGGNITGLSLQSPDLAGKRLELLREIIPELKRITVMAHVDYPAAVLEVGEVRTAAGVLGLSVEPLEIRRVEDIVPAFGALGSGTQALYVCGSALLFANYLRINILSAAARLPTIYASREGVVAGGLMSYGANVPSMFRRSAELVDKILRGATPGDLPVEQPTKFDLVLNLTTAKALGLDIPPMVLARADEVIE